MLVATRLLLLTREVSALVPQDGESSTTRMIYERGDPGDRAKKGGPVDLAAVRERLPCSIQTT